MSEVVDPDEPNDGVVVVANGFVFVRDDSVSNYGGPGVGNWYCAQSGRRYEWGGGFPICAFSDPMEPLAFTVLGNFKATTP